jgi:hypothetical protein
MTHDDERHTHDDDGDRAAREFTRRVEWRLGKKLADLSPSLRAATESLIEFARECRRELSR